MVIHITESNFEKEILKSDVPVMLDFSATWCGPCKMVAPSLEDISNDFEGKAKIAKIDIDESTSIAEKYNVMSVPTLMYFKNGEPVDKIIGAVPKDMIANKLKTIL